MESEEYEKEYEQQCKERNERGLRVVNSVIEVLRQEQVRRWEVEVFFKNIKSKLEEEVV